jgi:CHAD domain-containing protein
MKTKGLDVSLRADESVRAGLLRVADGLIQNALERIRRPTSDSSEDVHSVRVTIKRLRALLRLIRPVISETTFDRENARLRNAARRLSATRDSDVARRTAAALPLSEQLERNVVAAVLAGFNENGEPGVDINQVMREIASDLEQSRRNLHGARISENEWKAIEPGLSDVYRQSQKRMEAALGQGDDEAFHKWRIRVKNLYYELQFLEAVWGERVGKMVDGLRQLQEEIGADHDLTVLKRSLRNTPDAFGGAETVERVVSFLDGRSRKLRRVAKLHGKSILNKTPGHFVREFGQHWNTWRRGTARRKR